MCSIKRQMKKSKKVIRIKRATCKKHYRSIKYRTDLFLLSCYNDVLDDLLTIPSINYSTST
jgi:hypothetical protein